MSFRIRYWSCTKFADWLRGTKKPAYATSTEWENWRLDSEKLKPFRHWLAEELLDKIQDVVYWPYDQFTHIKSYINNRWVTKTHCLTASPNHIKPGQWCDLSDRILFCLFNELTDFVEIEVAWHHVTFDPAARDRYKVPWYRRTFFRIKDWRCPDAGIEHLVWASGLTNENELTNQAIASKEILTLYRWWKEVHANRPDPHEVGGWTAYCESKNHSFHSMIGQDENTPEEQLQCATALQETTRIEQEYAKEDEEMLIRLIRVRESLWT